MCDYCKQAVNAIITYTMNASVIKPSNYLELFHSVIIKVNFVVIV